jgi:hypothetical protein
VNRSLVSTITTVEAWRKAVYYKNGKGKRYRGETQRKLELTGRAYWCLVRENRWNAENRHGFILWVCANQPFRAPSEKDRSLMRDAREAQRHYAN